MAKTLAVLGIQDDVTFVPYSGNAEGLRSCNRGTESGPVKRGPMEKKSIRKRAQQGGDSYGLNIAPHLASIRC